MPHPILLLLLLLLVASPVSHADLEAALQHLVTSYESHVEDLKDLVSLPSVSASPEHLKDVRATAEWLVDRLTKAGLKGASIVETEGPRPVVYAEWIKTPSVEDADDAPKRITVIIYAHYDVQPVDPLDEWESPPFEMTRKAGKLYGRGADDDKGGLLMALHAVEAVLATCGSLPVDVKFLIEGEEEMMSPFLSPFLLSQRELLSADLVVSADGGQISEQQGGVGLGLRGVMGAEITVTTAASDMHSGMMGGSVANPNVVLARVLASLHDPESARVLVPGFYEGVSEPSAEDKADVAAMEFDEAADMEEVGAVGELYGEKGYSTLERRWFRPTLEVVGMHGGFTGNGIKTVLPRQASAKLSCRLVVGQHPADLLDKIKKHVASIAPAYANITVTALGGSSLAYSVNRGSAGNMAVASVLTRVFGNAPKYYRRGSTIPALAAFGPLLDLPVTTFAWGLGDHIHAPNERLSEVMYRAGHKAWAMLLFELGDNFQKSDFVGYRESSGVGAGAGNAMGGVGAGKGSKDEL